MSLVLASIVEAYSSLVGMDSRNGLDGIVAAAHHKRDHQARWASSAARTGATSPTCGATTIAAGPAVMSTTSNRRGAPRKGGAENCWNAACFVKRRL